MHLRRLLCFLAVFVFFRISFGQGIYGFVRADEVVCISQGDTLKNAWAGGMNFMLAGEMDLDFDGKPDLLFFDKSGFRLVPFLNRGTSGVSSYIYAPDYCSAFPKMEEWMILADYDRDGKTDIFTYFSGGIKIYRNTGSPSVGNRFEEFIYHLQSDYGSVTTSVYVPSTDLPGIYDIDGDGDLDVLTFDVFGGCVDFHKNMSMELFGHTDTLVYVLETRNWGNFKEDAFTNSVEINSDCSNNGERHAGSTFMLFDVNNDGVTDLLLGDIGFNNLVLLKNGGTVNNAQMTQLELNFPQNYGGAPAINMTVFPAAFYIDVNNDGVKDLLVSPTGDGRSENTASVRLYKNVGQNSSPSFVLESSAFIQNTMIDVGEGAYPVFVDFDGDGLLDIVVGNYGHFVSNNTYNGRLRAFKNNGTATNPSYELYSNDFAGLTGMGINGIVPTFGDLDGDGDLDMLVGEASGKLHYFRNTGTVTNPQFVLQAANFSGIQAGQYSAPCLFDLDNDGKLDIVVGNRQGILHYYRNTGTTQVPSFSALPTVANVGGVNVTDQTVSFYGYSVPFIFADAQNYQLFCGSYSGRIFHYRNLKNNINGAWELVTNVVDSLVYEGYRTAVSVADINNDGKIDMVMGNYSGGLSLFYGTIVNTSVTETDNKIDIRVSPNPFTESFVLLSATAGDKKEFVLYDLSGRKLFQSWWMGETLEVNLSQLPAGMYVGLVTQTKGTTYKFKLVKKD